MKIKSACVIVVLLCFLGSGAGAPRVLVYQKNGKGFVHDNLAASAAALRELGTRNGFGVDVSDDPSVFTVPALKQYRALIFANSNNEAFDNDEQRATPSSNTFAAAAGSSAFIRRPVRNVNGPIFSNCRERNSSGIHQCKNSLSRSSMRNIRLRITWKAPGSGRTNAIFLPT